MTRTETLSVNLQRTPPPRLHSFVQISAIDVALKFVYGGVLGLEDGVSLR